MSTIKFNLFHDANRNHVSVLYGLRANCNLFEKNRARNKLHKMHYLKNNIVKYIEKHDTGEYIDTYNI